MAGLLLACHVSVAEAAPPYTAVLIAGDDSLPVFDNAIAGFRDQLLAKNLAAPDTIKTLLADQAAPIAELATAQAIDDTIAMLHPGAGQGCLIYATSHGERNNGVFLSADKVDLTPAKLNAALGSGCAHAPTIVIISACFSGQFSTGAMRKANRVILTAARPDRTSFGCQAGRRYTVFDHCLLQGFDTAVTWRGLFKSVRACVALEERVERATPSEPQAYFGAAVPDRIFPVLAGGK